jgi:ADP-ribose pyrophosphatase
MKVLEKTPVYEGHFTIYNLVIEDGKETFEREQFHRGNSVAGLLYDTAKKKIVLVRQFRAGTENYLTEIVAGTVEKGEDPKATIVREIMEETGYKTDSIELISSFYMSPGSVTEKLSLYYCEVSEQATSGGGHADENEKIELTYLDEINNPYMFEDAKTIIAFEWYLRVKNKKGSLELPSS